VHVTSPVELAPQSPKRLAIILVTQPTGTTPRVGVAHADADLYRDTLRELGFEVITIGPAARPILERQMREVAARVPAGGEAAVFVLGSAVSWNDDLYLLPADIAAELASNPRLLPTEGVSLEAFMRRAMNSGPKHLVALVDECRPATGDEACGFGKVSETNASVIVAQRRAITSSGQPAPATRSVLQSVDPLMKTEGLSFLQLHARLRERVQNTPITLLATPTLANDFAFLPRDFFSRVRSICNDIDPNASVDAIRRTNLDPMIAACDRALQTWRYATRFSQLKDIAVEQNAFKRAIASCNDRPAAEAYLSTYATGKYRVQVSQHVTNCTPATPPQPERPHASLPAEKLCRSALDPGLNNWDPNPAYREFVIEANVRGLTVAQCVQIVRPQQAQPQQPVRTNHLSRAGWTGSFNLNDFYIDPQGDNIYEPQRESYRTVLKSRRQVGGEEAVIFVEVSSNQRCFRPSQYANETLGRNRIQRLRFDDRSNQSWFHFYVESSGFRAGNQVRDFMVYDLISTRRLDASSLFHVGARGPRELNGLLRTEFEAIIRSLNYPASGPFNDRCR
jgi:hypothetical protein